MPPGISLIDITATRLAILESYLANDAHASSFSDQARCKQAVTPRISSDKKELLIPFETGYIYAQFRHYIIRGIFNKLNFLFIFVKNLYINTQAL